MTEIKQSTPIQDKTTTPAMYWGTIALAVVGMVGIVTTLISILPLPRTIALIIAIVIYVLSILTAVVVIVLTVRGRQDLGSRVVFYLVMVIFGTTPFLFAGRALTASFSVATIAGIVILQLLPKTSKRSRYVFITGAVLVLLWAFEWINPPWRIEGGTRSGPATAIIFGLILTIIVLRQTWGRSLRNKLLVTFIGVTVLATGTLSAYSITTTTNALQASLERELSAVSVSHAAQLGDLFNEQINNLTALSLNETLQQAVKDQNQAYTGDASTIQAEIDSKDAQWRAADKANNNADPLVREHLTNPAAFALIEYRTAFPDNAEVFITDLHGGLVGSTNRTSDYNQADEAWWQAAYNNDKGGVYIGNPEFDESAGKLGIQFALPLRNHINGKIIGILRTTYIMTPLANILKQDIGETSSADIFIPTQADSHIHEGLLEPIDPQVFEQLKAVAGQGMAEMNYKGILSIVTQAKIKSRDGNPAVDNLGWVVVFHQNRAEAYAPVNERIRGTIIVIVVVIFLAVLAAIFLAQVLVRPLTQLTNTAQEIAAGNLNSQAQVTSADEIGKLAGAFNSMTSQLRELIGSLERRVAARTRDLAIVAEVGTATASILESKRLLQEVVDLTKERFHLYHSHIYLLDEKGENLVLTAGAGEPGRVMVAEGRSIPLDRERSLVARAARERRGVTVNDVTQAPDFLPNPLLPDTRSELAVPMIVGGKVIGVFDIQSEQVERFTEADVNIQTTLAAQLATSIQNVRSFEHSKKQAELQSLVNVIGSRIQRTTSIEETLQTAIRELGTAIGASRVSANVQVSHHKDDDGVNLAR